MRRRTLGTALLAAVVCLTGCTGAESHPEPAAEPGPATLATYDTQGLRVERGPFCERVSPTGVEHALGAPPAKNSRWVNGDRVRLPDGTRDRVHEYGCSWTAADGTRARAWVFAPPVQPRRARTLVSQAKGPGCSVTKGVGFGRASATATCTSHGVTEESYRGLFGDAWLTCAVAADDPDDLDVRASGWCVAVLEAARA